MTLKISDNLKTKMNEENGSRLKLSKNMERLSIKEEKIDISKMTLEDIKTYVRLHTVKTKSTYVAGESGVIIVPFSQFVEMIEDGYEIYKSEVLNKFYISIEYQKELKKDKSR